MYITPNPIAWLVLLSWPLVILVFFRKMTTDRALIWSILGAYMLLPPLLAMPGSSRGSPGVWHAGCRPPPPLLLLLLLVSAAARIRSTGSGARSARAAS